MTKPKCFEDIWEQFKSQGLLDSVWNLKDRLRHAIQSAFEVTRVEKRKDELNFKTAVMGWDECVEAIKEKQDKFMEEKKDGNL